MTDILTNGQVRVICLASTTNIISNVMILANGGLQLAVSLAQLDLNYILNVLQANKRFIKRHSHHSFLIFLCFLSSLRRRKMQRQEKTASLTLALAKKMPTNF